MNYHYITTVPQHKYSKVHIMCTTYIEVNNRDFPGTPVVKNLPCKAGDVGLILVKELRSHATEDLRPCVL